MTKRQRRSSRRAVQNFRQFRRLQQMQPPPNGANYVTLTTKLNKRVQA